MAHRPIYGHTALRARLTAAVRAGRLPSSLLLTGARGVGKQRLALWLGEYLLCERAREESLDAPCGACQHCRYAERGMHPDLHWFFPRPRLKDGDASPDDVAADLAEAVAERMEADGLWSAPSGSEGLHVATTRALVHQASVRPAMARHAVFVVGDAERMVSQEGADQAANAFLKLLEEPPPSTTLLLTSSEPGALLPTIRSRVVTVRVAPLRPHEVSAFLDDVAVQRRLGATNRDDAISRAAGAPGELLAGEANAAAFAAAGRLLDAALAASGPSATAERIKVATRQGVAGARGAFTDTLDALIVLLHRRTRELVARGAEVEARRLAMSLPIVEEARLRARGNVSPQLVTASLLDRIHHTVHP